MNTKEQAPGSYRIRPSSVEIVGAPVSARRSAVSRAVNAVTVPPRAISGTLPPRIISGTISTRGTGVRNLEPVSAPGREVLSEYEGDIKDLRDLSNDRIGFIRKYRILCEEKAGFRDGLMQWLGSRPLNIYLAGQAGSSCSGWALEGDSEDLLNDTCPRLRLRRKSMLFVADLVDVLRCTR